MSIETGRDAPAAPAFPGASRLARLRSLTERTADAALARISSVLDGAGSARAASAAHDESAGNSDLTEDTMVLGDDDPARSEAAVGLLLDAAGQSFSDARHRHRIIGPDSIPTFEKILLTVEEGGWELAAASTSGGEDDWLAILKRSAGATGQRCDHRFVFLDDYEDAAASLTRHGARGYRLADMDSTYGDVILMLARPTEAEPVAVEYRCRRYDDVEDMLRSLRDEQTRGWEVAGLDIEGEVNVAFERPLGASWPRCMHAFRTADRRDGISDALDEMETSGWELAALDGREDYWALVFKRCLRGPVPSVSGGER